jgi:hypothetical protein
MVFMFFGVIWSYLCSSNTNRFYSDTTVLKYVIWIITPYHGLEYHKIVPELFLNFKMDF